MSTANAPLANVSMARVSSTCSQRSGWIRSFPSRSKSTSNFSGSSDNKSLHQTANRCGCSLGGIDTVNLPSLTFQASLSACPSNPKDRSLEVHRDSPVALLTDA